MTTLKGDNNISFHAITTPHIEHRLVRELHINELYLSLNSTVVLKRKNEMLHVILDFYYGLKRDFLIDAGAYVSAIIPTEMDRNKQQAPTNFFKINNPPIFHIQVAEG